MSVNNTGCEVVSGWTYGCDLLQMHGVKSLYVLVHSGFPNDEIDATGVYYDSDDKIIATDLPASYWQSIQLLPETATYDWKEVEDSKTGLIYYDHVINFQVANYNAIARKYFLQLAHPKYAAVVGDNNGKYFLLGKDYGLRASGNGNGGKMTNDFGGINITLSGLQKFPPYEIAGSSIVYLNASVGGGGGGSSSSDIPIGS